MHFSQLNFEGFQFDFWHWFHYNFDEVCNLSKLIVDEGNHSLFFFGFGRIVGDDCGCVILGDIEFFVTLDIDVFVDY